MQEGENYEDDLSMTIQLLVEDGEKSMLPSATSKAAAGRGAEKRRAQS